jgi:ATP-dependent 26S proteasome regulatory subunit
MQAQQDAMRKSHMIFGEVLRVDGTTYVLKDDDGKEVSVKIDESTEKPPINKGDRIAANVDNQNLALWIRANRGTDRRTEHASADCNPN